MTGNTTELTENRRPWPAPLVVRCIFGWLLIIFIAGGCGRSEDVESSDPVQMGADVVLLEGHKMGGDCLNYGCVPSKALIASGKAAQ